jgi:hypothetical protein
MPEASKYSLCEACEQYHEYDPGIDRLVVYLGDVTFHHSVTVCPFCGHITRSFYDPDAVYELIEEGLALKLMVCVWAEDKVRTEYDKAKALAEARNVFYADFEPRLGDDAA